MQQGKLLQGYVMWCLLNYNSLFKNKSDLIEGCALYDVLCFSPLEHMLCSRLLIC